MKISGHDFNEMLATFPDIADKIKAISDDRIRERLRNMKSAKQVCHDLLQEALDGGGTDNITMIVARALPSER